MGREIKDIKIDLRVKLSKLRTLIYSIDKDYFEDIWLEASEKEREVAKKYIDNIDPDNLLQWMSKQPNLPKSRRKLIQRAKDLGIKNYSRLDKIELEQEIKDVEQKIKDNNDRRNREGVKGKGIPDP